MIQCIDVVKRYGDKTVLNRISVSFEKGLIHGIVGRNGSGKTMLLKAICGFIPLSGGEIRVWGKAVKSGRTPEGVGLIIEAPGFLPYYSGYRNLQILAGINGSVSGQRIRQVMELVGLDPGSRKWVSKYSMGMRQRLGIAQAVMEDPELLLLDEPMNGLDNQGVEDMRRLFLDFKAQGKTILLASHSREDIQALCDRVYKMDAGTLSPQDTPVPETV